MTGDPRRVLEDRLNRLPAGHPARNLVGQLRDAEGRELAAVVESIVRTLDAPRPKEREATP